MKKETTISILLLIIGFVFEYLHFQTERTFLGVKFWILGVVSILAGALGFWIYTITPFINGMSDNDSSG